MTTHSFWACLVLAACSGTIWAQRLSPLLTKGDTRSLAWAHSSTSTFTPWCEITSAPLDTSTHIQSSFYLPIEGWSGSCVRLQALWHTPTLIWQAAVSSTPCFKTISPWSEHLASVHAYSFVGREVSVCMGLYAGCWGRYWQGLLMEGAIHYRGHETIDLMGCFLHSVSDLGVDAVYQASLAMLCHASEKCLLLGECELSSGRPVCYRLAVESALWHQSQQRLLARAGVAFPQSMLGIGLAYEHSSLRLEASLLNHLSLGRCYAVSLGLAF